MTIISKISSKFQVLKNFVFIKLNHNFLHYTYQTGIFRLWKSQILQHAEPEFALYFNHFQPIIKSTITVLYCD